MWHLLKEKGNKEKTNLFPIIRAAIFAAELELDSKSDLDKGTRSVGHCIIWAPLITATRTINIKFWNYFYFKEHKISYQKIYNIRKCWFHPELWIFLVNFFCLFKNYSKKFTKKLSGINISKYFLIANFMLLQIKIISKFYLYCASLSDLWRTNVTVPKQYVPLDKYYLC